MDLRGPVKELIDHCSLIPKRKWASYFCKTEVWGQNENEEKSLGQLTI